MTPREAAKDLIRGYVERGDSIESLAAGCMGCSGSQYSAQISGYRWRREDLYKPNTKPVSKVGRYQIGVERIGEEEVFQVFSLKAIYQEIQTEMKTGKKEQLALF
jgi:hypothetical protein